MTEQSTTIELQSALDRLAAGDAKAKEELITRGLDRLMQIARKLLRAYGGEARAEIWTAEVLGEAYPRLDKALDDVRPTSVHQFLGLARLQMQRALLDRVRKIDGRGTDRPHVKPLSPDTDTGRGLDVADTDDGGRQRILVLDLLDALEKLPEKPAEVVWYRLEGYTFPEIGELMSVHKDTAERYWDQACVKLGQRLAPFMRGL